MKPFDNLGSVIRSSTEELVRDLVNLLPRLVGALLILLVGWLAAKFVRKLVLRGALLFDRGLRKLPWKSIADRSESSAASAKILGSLAYWGVLLIFLTAALQALAVEAISTWMSRIAQHLPSLVVGGLVIIVGVLLGGLVRDLVAATELLREKRQRAILGRVGQTIVICSAVLVGAEQIGIEVTFLIVLATIVIASFLFSLALALGLGAKNFFGNLFGAREARSTFGIGQMVRIGEYSGIIRDITNTFVVLESNEGRVTLPARRFCEQPIVLIIEPEAVSDE
jgi:hypothetical protein